MIRLQSDDSSVSSVSGGPVGVPARDWIDGLGLVCPRATAQLPPRLGAYEPIREIGRGPMSSVHLAREE